MKGSLGVTSTPRRSAWAANSEERQGSGRRSHRKLAPAEQSKSQPAKLSRAILLRASASRLRPSATCPATPLRIRSEERRVGKECVSTFTPRGSPAPTKKNEHKN